MGKKKRAITYNLELMKTAIQAAEKLGWTEIKLVNRNFNVTDLDDKNSRKEPVLLITGELSIVGIFVCPIVREI